MAMEEVVTMEEVALSCARGRSLIASAPPAHGSGVRQRGEGRAGLNRRTGTVLDHTRNALGRLQQAVPRAGLVHVHLERPKDGFVVGTSTRGRIREHEPGVVLGRD